MQTRLCAVAAGDREVWMPANGHWLLLITHVLRRDGRGHILARELDGEVEIGLRKPVAAEVPCVDRARYRLAIGCGGNLYGIPLPGEAASVHGVQLRARLLAGEVRRQG